MRRRIYNEQYELYRFSNVLEHLEQGCEELMRAVSKRGYRAHWDREIVRKANFPGNKAVPGYLKRLV